MPLMFETPALSSNPHSLICRGLLLFLACSVLAGTLAAQTDHSAQRAHGFLDSLHPELSGIVFSMVDEKGEPQDGFLRAHEIFNLKLPAELVVLSACQTGLGKEVKGEGLVGLTRGFMYAGAPRVVVSLERQRSGDGGADGPILSRHAER